MKVTSRLLTLARDSRFALVATVFSGVLSGLLIIAQAAGLSQILDGVFLGGKLLPDMAGLLRWLFLIILLRALLAWGSEISAKAVAVRVKNDLRHRLFEKFLILGPAYTHSERTGELVNTAVEGVEVLDAYFSQYLPQLIIAALVPFSILLVVFPRDPLSGLLLLLTAPLIPVFMVLIGKGAESLTRRQWDSLSRLSAHFLDSLQGLTTLKELGRSKDHATSITAASNRFRDITLGVLRVTFLSALVLELVASVSTALVAVQASLRLLSGQLTFQQAFFLLLLAPEFYIPLRMLGLRFHAGMSGTTAARRIFNILDVSEQERGCLQSGKTGIRPFSTLSCSDLSYTYPGETVSVLKNITLHIQAGEHVALVGKSGAGKSTLAALLLGFIHPDRGKIAIDDESFTSFSLESWRKMVAWVPQNPYLFHDTLAANLRLAQPDATGEQLAAAVKAAHLDEFIQSLPQGYETIVGEEGTRLSSGQAQRLALARAFLKDAFVLILDEPSSSLDPEQESLLESATHELMQGRTVITIAHRLNTVFQADRIFVLDQGCLVEEGTHGELLKRKGIYADLVNIPAGMERKISDLQADSGASGQAGKLTTKNPFANFDSGDVLITGDGNKCNLGKDVKSQKRNEIEAASFCEFGSNQQTSNGKRQLPVIFRLLQFLEGSWGWVALSVLLGVLTIGCNVGLMATSAFLISSASLHPELGTLYVAIVGVRFFGIARGVFRYAERLTTHNVTFRLLARLRTWFYCALEPLAPARLIHYRSGDLLARIVADVETLENFFVRVIAPPLVAIVVATGMIIYFGCFDGLLAWVYLAFMILLGIGVPLLAWTLGRAAGTELISRRAALQVRFVDGIQGLAELIMFNRGKDYSAILLVDGKGYGHTQQRLASLSGLSNALVILLVNLGALGLLALAIPLVTKGQVPGVMLAVLMLAALAGFEAVLPFPLAAQALSSSLQSARRLFEIVDATPVAREPFSMKGNKLLQPRFTNFELRILNLSFTYPGHSQPVLQDITFQLTPGKRVAVVGPSGAGKSTLANLLLRFWDYSQGQILLDDRDLHEFAPEEVRRLIAVISQKPYFFNDTIRQNLLLAQPTATQFDIQTAAEQAQIHEFIIQLPKGYETIIGERGFRLSSGERQRLAIARTLLKNAPIILLDEPTANLDPLNEMHFLDMLLSLVHRKSLLLITHRLVGLGNVDEILVLDHGRIVERGTQANLLAADGLYRRLWDSQNRILFNKNGT